MGHRVVDLRFWILDSRLARRPTAGMDTSSPHCVRAESKVATPYRESASWIDAGQSQLPMEPLHHPALLEIQTDARSSRLDFCDSGSRVRHDSAREQDGRCDRSGAAVPFGTMDVDRALLIGG